MQPQSKHPWATSGQYSFSGFLVFKCPRPTSQVPEHKDGLLAHPPKQPCSRCNAVPLLYLVDGIMRDSVLVIFPLGGSFSTNTSGVGSSASWTSACWLDSCKHTEPSQEQTLPSLWLPRGLAGGTPGWATCSPSLPDTLLKAKVNTVLLREKYIGEMYK